LALASMRERSTLWCGGRSLARLSEIARYPSRQCPRSPCAGGYGCRPADWAQAGQLPRCGFSRPAVCEAVCDRLKAQRASVRMGLLDPLVLVDLPVNVVVILEQQERAGQAVCPKGALCDGGVRRGEHMFVRYERPRTDSRRTGVRIHGASPKRRCRAIWRRWGCNETCRSTSWSPARRSGRPDAG
jgi:hypothetical protein